MPPLFVVAVAVLAAAVFSIGITRAWQWDESVTIGRYVKSPHLTAPIHGDLSNHVLVSVAEAGMYRLAGSTSEAYSRLFPVAAGVAAAALLGWLLARRYGPVVSLAGVAVFITNPIVFDVFRQVRGYSLMTLCAIASAALLPGLLTSASETAPGRWRRVAYVLTIAIGTGAHLYMLLPAALQIAFALARARQAIRKLLPSWVSGIALGIVVNALVLNRGLRSNTARKFNPTFPVDLLTSSLGSTPVAMLAIGGLLLVAIAGVWRRPESWATATAFLAALISIWFVFRPTFLYPRFFVWLIPGIALGVAHGLVRANRRGIPAMVLGLAVGAAVIAQLSVIIPTANEDEYANRTAADAGVELEGFGARVCTQAQSELVMSGYESFPLVVSESDLAACDVVIVLTEGLSVQRPESFHPDDLALARKLFPTERILPARSPGSLLATVDERCLAAPDSTCWKRE